MSAIAKANSKAPATEKMVEHIRRDLLGGQTAPSDYLPGERDLATRYGVGRITVRRALKLLVAEGLLRPERGHGYKALLKSAGEKPGSPLVFISSVDSYTVTEVDGNVASAVQDALVRAESQVLTVGVLGRPPEEVMRVIADVGAWGVLVENNSRALHEALSQSGLPCVAVDVVTDDLPMDCVLQDNHGGARAAAEHLIAKGHQRIGWFGDVAQTRHSLERFTGAQAAFLSHNMEMRREHIVSQSFDLNTAKTLLGRKDRPTAVLAMWRNRTETIARAAHELGLKIGRDLEIVGWTTKSDYRNLMEAEFAGCPRPTMVVWDRHDMAAAALERIELRRKNPNLRVVRINIPVQLVPGE